jgi:hypothetical protein
MVIWCDGEAQEGPLHASFTLDEAGGEIALFGPGHYGTVVVDSHSYGLQSPDVSEGRRVDGGLPWLFLEFPTPGATNNIGTGAPPAVAPLALSHHPNPFNPTTRLHFNAPRAGNARLEIFDPSGRRVAVLLDGPVAAGSHTLDWRAEDDQGRGLPSGLYLSRLTLNGEACQSKMMLLR